MKIDDLISGLVTEMFQAEESARKHPRKEAERLGGTPPGLAMAAISDHADRVFPELSRIADDLSLGKPGVGQALGNALSLVREGIIDRVVSQEKSYRGTLAGIQHSFDLFLLAGAAARAAGLGPLASFCAEWLRERRPLVEAVRDNVVWFADNVDRA